MNQKNIKEDKKPPKEQKNKLIQMRVSDTIKAHLDAVSKEVGIPITQYIMHLIIADYRSQSRFSQKGKAD